MPAQVFAHVDRADVSDASAKKISIGVPFGRASRVRAGRATYDLRTICRAGSTPFWAAGSDVRREGRSGATCELWASWCGRDSRDVDERKRIVAFGFGRRGEYLAVNLPRLPEATNRVAVREFRRQHGERRGVDPGAP